MKSQIWAEAVLIFSGIALIAVIVYSSVYGLIKGTALIKNSVYTLVSDIINTQQTRGYVVSVEKLYYSGTDVISVVRP